MSKNFSLNLGNLKVDQLGYVYKDIQKQAKIMESLFNVPKFIFMNEASDTFKYRGRDSKMTSIIAISRMGNTQIELIQWIDGNSTYKEFLDQGKEGLHHIATYVEDIQSYIDDFKKKGIEVLQSGEILRHLFAYMDTEKTFGIILEFLEKVKGKRRK